VSGISHPSRHYTYFLLSRQVYDLKAVIKALDSLDLPVPKDGKDLDTFVAQLSRVRHAMRFPHDFNPTADIPNDETLAFLHRWKITDAWRNSPFLLRAMDVLWAPQIRRMLELLILSPLSARAIADRVASRFDLSHDLMNAGVVKAYKHYLWDFNAMDLASWREFIKQHYETSSLEFMAALQAPHNKAGVAFVLSIVDKDPRLLSAADRYEMCSSVGFKKFMQHAFGDSSSSRDTYAAFTALNIMRMADNELDRYRGASAEFIQELQRISPVYDNKPPLSISDNLIRPSLPIVTQGEEVHDE
jgi:hypothetical protein